LPSAPTSKDLREGIEVEESEGWALLEERVQLPSPREVRIEESDFGYAVKVWRRCIVSEVKGTAEPLGGRVAMALMRRR